MTPADSLAVSHNLPRKVSRRTARVPAGGRRDRAAPRFPLRSGLRQEVRQRDAAKILGGRNGGERSRRPAGVTDAADQRSDLTVKRTSCWRRPRHELRASAGRGLICCSTACGLLISRVIRSWPAASCRHYAHPLWPAVIGRRRSVASRWLGFVRSCLLTCLVSEHEASRSSMV